LSSYLKRKIFSSLYRLLEFFSLNIFATHKITLGLDYRKRWKEFLKKPPSSTPALWIHGASLGELEDLASFFLNEELLKLAHYSFDRLIITSASPSAEAFLLKIQNKYPIRYAGPLPPDTGTQVKKFFSLLHPELLILSQSDTWPVLLTLARKYLDKGAIWIPHKEESAKWSRENLLDPLVKTVALRRESMKSPLPNTSSVFVGSPRIDRILERIEQSQNKEHPLKEKIEKNNKVKILIASAWKEDAFVWVKALEKSTSPDDFDLYIIPHDIHDQNEILSISGFFHKKVILREGILLESYKDFDLAFVGGGFRTGLHNIVEPLAWGIPTLCGSDLRKQPEAPDFVSSEALTPVQNEDELASFLEQWRTDEAFRKAKKEAALKTQSKLLQQKGASKRLAELIRLYFE